MEAGGASAARTLWPHVRAALVLGHVVAVILLSLPGGGITSKAQWKSDNLRSDVAGWGKTLRSAGVDVTDDELAKKTFEVAKSYVDVREVLIAPIRHYPEATGARQGWAMFASPQRHPAEVHVDVFDGQQWQPVFRPRSDEHRWFADRLDHHRLRKLAGRFARGFRRDVYADLATYLGDKALEDFPNASRARVRLYRWDALRPEEVRAGAVPKGKYTELRQFSREKGAEGDKPARPRKTGAKTGAKTGKRSSAPRAP